MTTRISNRSNEISLEEYVQPLEPFFTIQNYSAMNRKGNSIEIEIGERPVKINGINQDEQIKEFEGTFKRLVEPVVKNTDLKKVLESENERIEGLFENLPTYFTSLEMTKYALGEKLYSRVLKKLPIKWKLSKENVPRLHGFIENHIENIKERYERKPCQGEEEEQARKIFRQFEAIKDHYLEDNVLPFFIPILQVPIWPKVEKIKQALRDYFRIENMVNSVTEKMIDHLIALKGKLKSEEREALASEIEKTFLKDERLKIIDRLGISFSEEEKLIFFDFLYFFLPPVDELLLSPFEALFSPNEIDFTHRNLRTLNFNAMEALEKVCFETHLSIEFRKRGTDIDVSLGKR